MTLIKADKVGSISIKDSTFDGHSTVRIKAKCACGYFFEGTIQGDVRIDSGKCPDCGSTTFDFEMHAVSASES